MIKFFVSSMAALLLHPAQAESRYFSGPDVALELAIQNDSRDEVSRAIASGANPNARGQQDITPLMIAVDRKKQNAVAELLDRGANPNAKAKDGNSPISLAIENYAKNPNISLILILAGGDPNTRRPDNDPVIMRFVNDRNCDFIRQWKALGADLDVVTRAGDPIVTNLSREIL